jgi:hypothetical protein
MSAEPGFVGKLLAINRELAGARLDFAFGGAIALNYYSEPRATIDLDINLFCAVSEFDRVAKVLGGLGVDTTVDRARLERTEQCRLHWGMTPLDLFFAYNALHDEMATHLRRKPLGGELIPILSPEHLIVCKACFDRSKDWPDIERTVAFGPALDRAAVEGWLERLLGPDAEQLARFRAIAENFLGPAR